MAKQHITLNGEKLPIEFNSYVIFEFMNEHGIKMSQIGNLVENFKYIFDITYEAVKEAYRQKGKEFKHEQKDFCIELSKYPKSVAFATNLLMKEIQQFMEVYSKAQEGYVDEKK